MREKTTRKKTLRNLTSLGFILLPISIAPNAFAGFVSAASFGVVMPSLEAGNLEEAGDAGYVLGASLGWRFGDIFQWDVVDLYYMSADQDDGLGIYTASNYSAGTGIRLGSFGDSRLQPYVSFGIAASRTDLEVSGLTSSADWGFEWNAGAGLLFSLSDSLALGVRYRYRSSSIPSVLGIPLNDVNVNLHTIAAEVSFGN